MVALAVPIPRSALIEVADLLLLAFLLLAALIVALRVLAVLVITVLTVPVRALTLGWRLTTLLATWGQLNRCLRVCSDSFLGSIHDDSCRHRCCISDVLAIGCRRTLIRFGPSCTGLLDVASAITISSKTGAFHDEGISTLELPDDPVALNNLAYLLADWAKQNDEALKLAQRTVELAPDNPNYLDTLGWVLYHKGLYQPAIDYLKRAVAKGGAPVLRYHLAMAYAKAGDSSRAREMLAVALKNSPQAPEAKQAMAIVLPRN